MDLGIDGRVALVLGASRGLGRAAAEALAGEGARVALASRSAERLEQVAAGIGSETAVFAADTDQPEAIADLPARVEEQVGPIEILVLNTGGPPPGCALESSRADWEAAYRSLVLTPLVLVESLVGGMRQRGWGRVINVGSTSTREPIPGLTLSNSNRAAAVGLLNTLAREVAADGVTINTIATGRFGTERLAQMYGSIDAAQRQAEADVPAARLGTPEEYGDLVAFLASERAGYLTGAVIPLDGGLTRSA